MILYFSPPEIVAWFGAIPILILFIIFNRKRVNLVALILLLPFIYITSIINGILFAEYRLVRGDLSAIIAGLIAPFFIATILTLIIRFTNSFNFLIYAHSC